MLQEKIGKELLIFDGAMGSQLQARGLQAGEVPELLNITNPAEIIEIHEAYLNAGANFITTNTFGANPSKVANYQEVILAAIDNAKTAREHCEKDAMIMLDIGPIGALMEPLGSLTFDEVYDLVKAQIEVARDHVDGILIETMTDVYEVKATVLAIKETCDLPIFATMTFEEGGRTLSGTTPETMVNILEGLGVDVLGVNCSLGPDELGDIVERILASAHVPVMVQPNAGLPCMIDGHTHYTITPDHFAESIQRFIDMGVSIIGGCCGTTPEFISLLSGFDKTLHRRNNPQETKVSSGQKTVTLDRRIVVCGERLNPTGKKKLKRALKNKQFDEVVLEAIKQEQAGAHVLDVNVGVPGIDEPQTMKQVVQKVQEVIDLPLQIDSSNLEAMEIGCRYYNGRPLLNSVNGTKESMDAIFPIVKKYGARVIGLCLDEEGIPDKAEKRFEIAKKIIKEAAKYGIGKESIVIDCLVLTASAKQEEVMETIKAVQMVSSIGVKTVLGVSNVSFGLPNRPLLNRTFLSLAMGAGLTMPIMNPLDSAMMDAVMAFDVLNAEDKQADFYIEKQVDQKVETKTTDFSLYDMIVRGMKDQVEAKTKEELRHTEAMDIINNIIIPALDEVGKGFEKGTIFLPQLMQAANTTKAAFDVLKDTFKSDQPMKGPLLICTVEGDIHDIGKNIVKVVLESYGYEVIDLGKDVPKERVLEAFYEYHPKMIGLSALMTTTVVNMEKTIQLLKSVDGMVPIFVGGAVLTYDYAMEIGADYYSKDALGAVEVVNKVFEERYNDHS